MMVDQGAGVTNGCAAHRFGASAQRGRVRSLCSPFRLMICALLLAASRPGTSAAAEAESRSPASPVPTDLAAVQIRNGPAPGALELRAHGTVELSPDLIVERQRDDGSFEPLLHLDLDSMKLVTACDQRPNACVKVDERGLRPVPWSGMSCSSQCNRKCDKN